MRPGRLLLSHVLSPVDWILGDMKSGGARDVARKVMASVLKEKLEILEGASEASPAPAYILYGRAENEIYVFFNGKGLRNKLVEAIIKRSSEAEKVFRP